MAYDDNLLGDDERVAPTEDFYEHLGNADMGEDMSGDDLENMVPDEGDTSMDTPATDSMSDTEANRGFRERLDEPDESGDDAFTRSLDENENPYIGDQLSDTSLQHDGDDYL